MKIKETTAKETIILLILVCLFLPVTMCSMGCLEDNGCKSVKLRFISAEQTFHKYSIEVTNMEDHPLYDVQVNVSSLELYGQSAVVTDHEPATLGDIEVGETKSDDCYIIYHLRDNITKPFTGKVKFLVTWNWKGQQSCTTGEYTID